MGRLFRMIVVYPALLALTVATFSVLIVWALIKWPFAKLFGKSEPETEEEPEEIWGRSPVEELDRLEKSMADHGFMPTAPFVRRCPRNN